MKKTCVFIVLANILYAGVLAQTGEYFGKLDFHEISYVGYGEVHTVVPGSEGSLYTLSAKGVKTTAHLVNADLKHQDSYFIESAYYRSGAENAGMEYTRIGDKFYMIYGKDIKNVFTLYAVELSKPKDVTTLGTLSFNERTETDIENLLVSPSSSFFAVECKVQTVDVLQSHVFVFDQNMTKVAQYNIDMPLETSIRQFVLSDFGDLFCMDIRSNEGEKKKDVTELYQFRLYRNGVEAGSHVLNNISSTAITASLAVDTNQFYAYLLTSEDKEVTIDGKKSSKPEYVLRHWKFNDTAQVTLETENKISRTTIEKLKTHDKIFGGHIALKGAFVMNDGSTILVADASSHRAASTSYSFGEMKSRNESWSYTGIMIAHLDPEGNMTDTKLYHRKFIGVVYMVMPVIPVRMENSVLFSYIDEDKSIHFVNAFVNVEGVLDTQKKTYTNDTLDKRAIIQESFTSDGNKTAYAVVAFKNEVVRIHVE